MVDLEEITLSLDEFEAIRLIDFNEISQEDAGKKMQISQSTLSRILKSARKKISEALIKGKAINILNPAEPPIIMANSIIVEVENPNEKEIRKSVESMVKDVQKYVPGYELRVPTIVDDNKVTTIIQVEGAGDFLPKYSGNLDIMTAAAVAVGEYLAQNVI